MLCRNDECDEEGIEINSDYPEEAAEMFAERADQRGDGVREHQIVSVFINGQWKDYNVWSHYRVRYSARENKEKTPT
jgi:hypothetical protein